MELEILQNNFETAYKEYKDYESFLVSERVEIQKQRDSFKERVISGTDSDDVLVSALFDLSIRPIQSEEDLRVLRDRLIAVYDAYKIVIDFPAEIVEEMKNLQRPYQVYRIHNGSQVDIDKEKNDKFRDEARKKHAEVLKELKIQ